MGKRFTETTKWSDPWFRTLPVSHKAAWQYLTDNCDCAGVIDLDRDLANFQIGATIDWDAFISSSGDRIRFIQKGKIWITGFVSFQCGNLSEASKPHQGVMLALKKHGVWKEYAKGIQSHKEKETEKEKDKGGCGGAFDAWWSIVPNRVGKQDASKAYDRAVAAIAGRKPSVGPGGDDPQGFLLERMEAFAASPKAKSEFCPHPATWLNQGRYDDDPETWSRNGAMTEKAKRGPEMDPRKANASYNPGG